MDYFEKYMRYREMGYSEASAAKLASEADVDDEYGFDDDGEW